MKARTVAAWFLVVVGAQLLAGAAAAVLGWPFIAFFIVLLSLASAVFFVATAYSVFFGAPFVPIDRERIAEMLDLAKIKPGEKLVDLGSGDGRVVIAAAKAGANAEGWEINPYLWLLSRWNIRRAGVADRATVHLGSYWHVRFADADVITLFLITMQMRRMQEKLRAELRPGGRVASYAFTFPDWKHAGKSPAGVYLYVR